MLTVTFESLTAFLLIFVRTSGAILLNPIFSRRNVPSQLQLGFVFCLTLLLAPVIDASALAGLNEIEIIFTIFKEFFVGLICSFVFIIFYYLLFFAGDFMDIEFGLSMAKVFDPGTSIQMSVSGTILNIIFVLYIFATDSHLLLIRIFASSYQIIPLGAMGLTTEISSFFINLILSVISLAIRLALPFAVVQFTIEVGMGVLMKLIPQIHVFVINIQTKLLMGILLLFLFAQPVGSFIDNYISIMFENMQNALRAAVG